MEICISHDYDIAHDGRKCPACTLVGERDEAQQALERAEDEVERLDAEVGERRDEISTLSQELERVTAQRDEYEGNARAG